MSRQGWLHVGLVPCRDLTFCLMTVGLQCGIEVCRDRGFPIAKSLPLGVATQHCGVAIELSWQGKVATERATERCVHALWT